MLTQEPASIRGCRFLEGLLRELFRSIYLFSVPRGADMSLAARIMGYSNPRFVSGKFMPAYWTGRILISFIVLELSWFDFSCSSAFKMENSRLRPIRKLTSKKSEMAKLEL